MSRRHTPTLPATIRRTLGAATALVLAIGVVLPTVAVAQSDDAIIRPRDIQHEWQLLTLRDEKGNVEDVLPGVGATMQLRSGAAFGDGACSTYDSNYNQADRRLDVFIAEDEVVWRECDDISRAFDEQFYLNLSEIAAIEVADDVLVLNDVIGDPLMTFTRAEIDSDPTAARWTLARIGDADGSVEPVLQGLDPWMEFLVGGSIVGNTGCGYFLGKYATNEGRIDITDVDYRLESCADGARTQAQRILATLEEVTDFRVRPAGLALEDENGFIRLALEPDLDIASIIWTPTAIYDADGRQQYGSGNELTTSAVQFHAGKVEGRSICRPFFVEDALRSGLAVNIGTIEFVGAYCKGKTQGETLGAIEAAFITALEDTASYALRGDELSLTDVNGFVRAVLQPQPPLTGTTWAVYRMFINKKLRAPQTDVPITATFEDVDAAVISIVKGSTGVANSFDENTYFGTYRTPQATRVKDMSLEVTGKGCDKPKYKKASACQNQDRFIKLLEGADSYIVRDGELWFRDGRRTTITFRPLQLSALDE